MKRGSYSDKPKVDYGRVKDGTHPGTLVQIIDLGYQKQTDWKTQQPVLDDDGNQVEKHELMFVFETPTQKIAVEGDYFGKPYQLPKTVTMSWHEKSALTGIVNSLDPSQEKEQLEDMLGDNLLLQVGTTSGGNAKVAATSPIIEGMGPFEPSDPDKVYLFDQSAPDQAIWDKLPKWIKTKISQGTGFAELSKKINTADE